MKLITKLIFALLVFCLCGCGLFEDEDECSSEGTSCEGNVLKTCGCGESGVTPEVTCSLSKTDCSDYGAVCLFDGSSTHGCYYKGITCSENISTACIGNMIGDCAHEGIFCPNAVQATDTVQECDESEEVKYPLISKDRSCEEQDMYCMETTTQPIKAICSYWPERCDPETDILPECNTAIKDNIVFSCEDGVWKKSDCGSSICCETADGATCMESCEK